MVGPETVGGSTVSWLHSLLLDDFRVYEIYID